MRKLGLVLPLLLLVVCTRVAAAEAKTLLDYVEAGCPSPGKTWSGIDYSTVLRMTQAGDLPVLRRSDKELGPVFDRLVSNANLLGLKHRAVPVQLRFGEAAMIMNGTGGLLGLYLNQFAKGERVGVEMAALSAFLLDVMATAFELADEFMVSVPAEKQTEQMKEGLQQMQRGMIQSFEGALITGTDSVSLATEDQVVLLTAFAAHFPRIQSFLPDTVVAEFQRKVSQLTAAERNEQVRYTLEKIQEGFRNYRKK